MRPEWVKTYRCRDGSEAECEECSGKKDCWHRDGFTQVVETDMTAGWRRFLLLVHLKCDHDRIEFKLYVDRVFSGTLRYTWDGKPINSSNFNLTGPSSPVTDEPGNTFKPRPRAPNKMSAAIDISAPGGHELVFEYTPGTVNQMRNHSARLSAPAFFMPNTFALCEDNKVCLRTLGKTSQGFALRSSNIEQVRCLAAQMDDDNHLADACTDWLECLSKNPDQAEHIRMLLAAAGVSTTVALVDTPLQRLSSSAVALVDTSLQRLNSSSGSHRDTSCMDPRYEDPESWECDCFVQMQSTCEAVQQEHPDLNSMRHCLSGLWCQSDLVCSEWVDLVCHTPDVEPYATYFKDADALLQKHVMQETGTEKRLASLDSTMGGKLCN